MLYPLVFKPVFQERIWGGRNIERLYGKELPAKVPIGESREICDRSDVQSEITNGPLRGKTLHSLMQHHRADLTGKAAALNDRFRLLINILDAEEQPSLQVHPPASKAAARGGEPKTEMWYIAQARKNAELYVGLRKNVSRAEFESGISDGTVAKCFHRINVQKGDAMFLPSGRVHAIGAGLVIFEIQQNSDTTYRVFDWNRVGLEGKPRPLHIRESLASIDFNDFEPSLIQSKYSRNPTISIRFLVDHPLFRVDACKVKRGQRFHLRIPAAHILAIVKGRMELTWAEHTLLLKAGDFVLLPLCLERVTLTAQTQLEYLQVHIGK